MLDVTLIMRLVEIAALIIAIRAFILQKKEVIKAGKMKALEMQSRIASEVIANREKVLADLKKKDKNWQLLANKINYELKPIKRMADIEMLTLANDYEGAPDSTKVMDVLLKDARRAEKKRLLLEAQGSANIIA